MNSVHAGRILGRIRQRAADATLGDRAAGRGVWLSGSPDRWIDDGAGDRLREATHIELGQALMAGQPAAMLREIGLEAERLAQAADHAVDPSWSTAEVAESWMQLPLCELPEAVGALPAVRERWARLGLDPEPTPFHPVDTRDLPVGHPIAPVDAPDVWLLHGDVRRAASVWAQVLPPLAGVVEDPPYATGQRNLPYRDRFPPGAWRSLLRGHLETVRPTLAPDAVLALHIDEHRGPELQRLVEHVFGVEQALGTVVWDKRNPKGDAIGVAHQHELIVFATREAAALRTRGGLRRRKPHAAQLLERARALVEAHGIEEARTRFRAWVRAHPDLSGGERAYARLDEAGAVHRPVSMAWPNKQRPPDAYFEPLLHPVTGEPCPVPRRGWRNPPATMARLRAEGRLLFGVDHRTQPTRKYLLSDTVWENLPSLLYFAGSDDALQRHMGFDWPHCKPLAVVERIVEAAAPRGGWILDGFGGSGSTAHAALRMNARDAHRRRVVMCETQDPDRVILPRLARVGVADTWSEGEPAGTGRPVRVLVSRLAAHGERSCDPSGSLQDLRRWLTVPPPPGA